MNLDFPGKVFKNIFQQISIGASGSNKTQLEGQKDKRENYKQVYRCSEQIRAHREMKVEIVDLRCDQGGYRRGCHG